MRRVKTRDEAFRGLVFAFLELVGVFSGGRFDRVAFEVCMSGHETGGTEEESVASTHGVLLLSVEVDGWEEWMDGKSGKGEAVRVGCMYVLALLWVRSS